MDLAGITVMNSLEEAEMAPPQNVSVAQAAKPSVIQTVWPLADIKVATVLRRSVPSDDNARAALTAKIRQRGSVDTPLDVTPAGILVDGYARYDAAREIALEAIPVLVHQEWADLLEAELVLESIERNVETRRHLTQPQWVQVGRTIEAAEITLAAKRKAQGRIRGGKAGRRKKETLEGKVPRKLESQRALDVVARRIGMDRKTYERGKRILEAYEDGEAPLARLYVEDIVSAGLMLRALETHPSVAEQHAILTNVDQAGEDPARRRRVARAELKRLLPTEATKRLEVTGVMKRLSTLRADLSGIMDAGLLTLDAEDRRTLLSELETVAVQLAEFHSRIKGAE